MEPLKACTDLNSFSHEKAAEKYDKVIPIEPSEIYGTWEMIASYFTIDTRSKTTFRLEGRKYVIKEGGVLGIDNSAVGIDLKDRKWKLTSKNTRFQYDDESYLVRVKGDTMEWISKYESDYGYFVLVKQ